METRFFKSIEDWVNSKPDKETVARVLATVNRGVVTGIRKQIRVKKSEVKKMEKMVNAMKDVGFPIDDSVLKKINETKSEITSLEKQLPQQKD
jgi:hypothetical protein